MEHLLSFGPSPVVVPYLCTEMYDGAQFPTYLSRKGWKLEDLIHGNLGERSPQEAGAFLQAWLYFGLLSHVFRPIEACCFDPYDFIDTTATGYRTVTTKKLPDYIIKWNEWEQSRSPEQRKARHDAIQPCLKVCGFLVARFCRVRPHDHERSPSQYPISPEVAISILILLDTLTYAGFTITGHPFNMEWGASELLIEHMQKQGWCPSAVTTLVKGQQIHNLYSASTLGPPPRIQDHTHCTSTVCITDQIDENSYRTRHRQRCDDNDCVFSPELAKRYLVHGTIRQGRTPLVLCPDPNHRSGSRVEIVDEMMYPVYVAISHVWTGGLGNPRENTLPECQLRHIQRLVNQVMSGAETPWWLDTICIPPRREDYELRKSAIRRMRTIYREADKVLVFDEELMVLSKHSNPIEIYLRLKLSSWMRRLWTFQEAVMARNLIIQFADGTSSIHDIALAVKRESKSSSRNLYTRYNHLAQPFLNALVNPYASSTTDPVPKFSRIFRQLQWRSTSRASDEAVCLAGIMDFDAGPILDEPETDLEARMVKLLRGMKEFPLVILYQPPPRLRQEGFRWAPTSFLNAFRKAPTNPFRVMKGTGIIGPGSGPNSGSDGRGLLFTGPGFRLRNHGNASNQLDIGETFLLATDCSQSPTFRTYYWYDEDQTATNVDGSCSITNPAIIGLETPWERHPLALVDCADMATESVSMKATFIALLGLNPLQSKAPSDAAANLREPILHVTKHLTADQQWLLY